MVDDMKKLVEKYKRELMEYSRSSSSEKPSPLHFPEMIADSPKEGGADNKPTAQAVKKETHEKAESPAKKPKPELVTPVLETVTNVPRQGAPAQVPHPMPQTPRTAVPAPQQSVLSPQTASPAPRQTAPNPQTTAFASQTAPNNAQQSPSSPNTAPENSESFQDDTEINWQSYPTDEFLLDAETDRQTPSESTNSKPQVIGFVQNDDGVMRGDFKDVLSKSENNANKTLSSNDNIRYSSTESTNRLPETPVSGQSPNEQLGRRDFENTPETRNSRSDIKPLETQTNGTHEMQPEREYADLQDFYNINNQRGTLRFRVYTAREALPVTGAKIEVTKIIGNDKHTFYKLTTDISGNTSIVYLPAPSSELSQQPENTTQPYALYDAYITADNFGDVSIKNLPIFDGILSEQSIAMVPMVAGGTPEQITEYGPRVNGGV